MSNCLVKLFLINLFFLSSLTFSYPPVNTIINYLAGFSSPVGLAIAPDGTKMVVVSSNDLAYLVDITTVTPTILSQISPGYLLRGVVITPDSSKAYAIDYYGTVVVFDISTNNILLDATIALSPANDPAGIAISQDGSKVYVLGNNHNTASTLANIEVIDTVNNTIDSSAEITLNVADNPVAIVISPDGSTAYVSNQSAGNISQIDLVTKNITTITGTGTALMGASNLVITPNGNSLFVSDGSVSGFTTVDLSVNPVNSIYNSYAGEISFLTTMPDGKTIYTTGVSPLPPYTTPAEVVIDVDSNSVTGDLNNITGQTVINPFAIAITPNGRLGYFVDQANGNLFIFTTNLAILPPTNFQGYATQNYFLVQTDLINRLNWGAPSTGSTPVSYKIYRDAGLTQLVATIPANGTLQYDDHNRQPNTSYAYYLVSVDGSGNLSTPVSIVVNT